MNHTMHIQLNGRTDVGCVRRGNEDCFVIVEVGKDSVGLNPKDSYHIRENSGLFLAVSDGMGGAAAGEIASQTALTSLEEYVASHAAVLARATPHQLVAVLEEGVHNANRAILQKAREFTNHKGMGATITAGYLKDDVIYFFQIGDSRAYVLREGKLIRVTRDQSFVGHLVEMGTITEEQAMRHPQRNVILQALGTQEKLKVDISYLPLCKGDLVIVCSDGLYGEFLPHDFEELVRGVDNQSLEEAVNTLMEGAKKAGGRDNITLIGIRAHEGPPPREPGEIPRYRPYNDLDMDNPFNSGGLLQ